MLVGLTVVLLPLVRNKHEICWLLKVNEDERGCILERTQVSAGNSFPDSAVLDDAVLHDARRCRAEVRAGRKDRRGQAGNPK